MGKTVMMFGLGDLGGWVLEFLARTYGIGTIITCDAREDWPRLKTECAAVGAGMEGYTKTIKFEKCDVTDIDATAELLKKYNPDMIYSGMTLTGWLEMRVVPHAVGPKFYRATACHMPLQLLLVSKLMKARKKAGITAPVLNNSFPDGVNPVLARNGLGPLIGGGNLDLIAGEIRRKVSLSENVPMRDVIVYFIADHAVVPQGAYVKGSKVQAPYILKIMVGDKDITKKFDTDALILDSLLMGTLPSQTSHINHPVVAASSVKNIKAFINDTNELTCAPGPNGLPGGYTVRIGAKGVKVELPEGVTLDQAVKINLEGLKLEGIEEIKDDGTVVLTDEAYKVQKELYGFTRRELRFADMDDIAKETRTALKKLIDKYS
jgi:hypothetical protein